jgi:hypothetical protein
MKECLDSILGLLSYWHLQLPFLLPVPVSLSCDLFLTSRSEVIIEFLRDK